MSPDPCPYFDAIVPSGVLANFPPPYTAPIAVYVAQRTQMAAPGHGPNRAQMRPSGEIARMAHLTQPTAIDRVRGRSWTRISPQPGYTSPIGRSTEFRGVSEATDRPFLSRPTSAHLGNGRFGHKNGHAAPYNELISPDWCPNFVAGVISTEDLRPIPPL